MVYKTENQIKMALGINAWRNLLNDKLIRFSEMMPDMEKDVMMEIIGQLPQFWVFSKETLTQLENDHLLESGQISQYALKEIRMIISNDLDCDRSTPEDRKRFIDTILQGFSQKTELLTRDRNFFLSIQKSNNYSTRHIVLATLTYIGGRLTQAD